MHSSLVHTIADFLGVWGSLAFCHFNFILGTKFSEMKPRIVKAFCRDFWVLTVHKAWPYWTIIFKFVYRYRYIYIHVVLIQLDICFSYIYAMYLMMLFSIKYYRYWYVPSIVCFKNNKNNISIKATNFKNKHHGNFANK